MKTTKRIMAGLVAGAVVLGQAMAGNFGTPPANYRTDTVDYVESRMDNARGMRIEFRGKPYRAYADIGGYEGLPAWAVDVRVRSRLPGGRSGVAPYTVIFVDGDAIALEEDNVRLTRL